MGLKIFLLFAYFVANLFGFFALIATILNLPFRAFFRDRNKNSKSDKREIKSYWLGHLTLILVLFYTWEEIVLIFPTLTLILALVLSSLLSIVLIENNRTLYRYYRKFYISKKEKITFIFCLLFLYCLGLIFDKINFILW